MIIELNFVKISKTLKKSTAKPQPVNLPETPGHTMGVHQRAADSLQSF